LGLKRRAGSVREGMIRVSSTGWGTGSCGGLAAAELKKKELEAEGKEETDDPDAERDGLSGGD
jgi:hypothetical protein